MEKQKKNIKPQKCTACGVEIDCLDFDVTATCSSSLYQEDVVKSWWGKTAVEAYDSDTLMSNVEFNNFRCPECDTILFDTEEEAINFLKEVNN